MRKEYILIFLLAFVLSYWALNKEPTIEGIDEGDEGGNLTIGDFPIVETPIDTSRVFDPNTDFALIRAINIEIKRITLDDDMDAYLREYHKIGEYTNLAKGARNKEAVTDLLTRTNFEVYPFDDFKNYLASISSYQNPYSNLIGSSMSPAIRSFENGLNNESYDAYLFDRNVISDITKGVWGTYQDPDCGFLQREGVCKQEDNAETMRVASFYISDIKTVAIEAQKEASRYKDVLREQAIKNLVSQGWKIKGYV